MCMSGLPPFTADQCTCLPQDCMLCDGRSHEENEPTSYRSPMELSEFAELEEFPECRRAGKNP